MMRQSKRAWPLVVLCFLVTVASQGAELRGTVVEVTGTRVKIRIVGEQIPGAGDKVQIGSEVPDVGFVALEGAWLVTAVEGEFARAEPSGTTNAKPLPGMAAVIASSTPHPKQAEVDYMQLFPADMILAMKIRNLDAFRKSAQKTALLKSLESPELKPLADILATRLEKEMGPRLPLFQKWLGHFNGQVAIGVGVKDPMGTMEPRNRRMALVAELTSDTLEKTYQEFLTEWQLRKNTTTIRFNGLTILKAPNDDGAITRVDRHVVLGSNVESVQLVAPNLQESPAHAARPVSSYAKALSAAGVSDPDIVVAIDLKRYRDLIDESGTQNPTMLDARRMSGFGSMDFVLVTARTIGDRFEDRVTVILNDSPSRFVDLMKQVAAAEVDVKKALACVPAGAIVVGIGYLDAATMGPTALNWLKEQAHAVTQVESAAADQELLAFENLTGIKLADLFSTVKGNMAFWVELAPALALPHIGSCVECPDAVKAQELANHVGRYLDVAARSLPLPVEGHNAKGAPPQPARDEGQEAGQPVGPPRPTFQKIDFKGHTIFTEADESPLVQTKKREAIVARLTWAVHGNRLFLTDSVVQMQKRLTALDAGAPGFDFNRFLPVGQTVRSDARGVLLVDLKRGMDFGARHGFPLLASAAGKDKELQAEIARLGELAAEKSLFEGVPPLMVVGVPPKDHVLSAVMWSPVSYTAATMLLGMAAVVLPVETKPEPQTDQPTDTGR